MKILKTIKIDKPIDTVWKVFVEDFESADVWMKDVVKSYAKTEGVIVDGASMSGRVCEISEKPNSMYFDETITAVDKANHTITIEVIPTNAPFVMPIKKNTLTVRMKSLSDAQTEFVWDATVELKPLAFFLTPLLKIGIGKLHGSVVDEMKYFTETGKTLN